MQVENVYSINDTTFIRDNFKLPDFSGPLEPLVDPNIIDLTESDDETASPKEELTTLNSATPSNLSSLQLEHNKLFPVNEEQTNYIYQHATRCTTLQRNCEPAMLKFVPIRDMLPPNRNEQMWLQKHEKQTIKPREFRFADIPKTYPCSICSTSFVSEQGFDEHMRAHARQNSFACGICDVWYPSWALFARHAKEHSDREYLCGICGQTLNDLQDMTAHKKRHPRKSSFLCPVCMEMFSTTFDIYHHRLGFQCILKKSE